MLEPRHGQIGLASGNIGACIVSEVGSLRRSCVRRLTVCSIRLAITNSRIRVSRYISPPKTSTNLKPPPKYTHANRQNGKKQESVNRIHRIYS
jgi:hypothetical protein